PRTATIRDLRRERRSDRGAVPPSWTQATTPRPLRPGLSDRCDAEDEPHPSASEPKGALTRIRGSPTRNRRIPYSAPGPCPLPEPECCHPGGHDPAQGRVDVVEQLLARRLISADHPVDHDLHPGADEHIAEDAPIPRGQCGPGGHLGQTVDQLRGEWTGICAVELVDTRGHADVLEEVDLRLDRIALRPVEEGRDEAAQHLRGGVPVSRVSVRGCTPAPGESLSAAPATG